MFKEMLSPKIETEKYPVKEIGSNVNGIDNSQLKFREILCPKSFQPLSSKQCITCPHMIEQHRAHKSGFSMATMICRFTIKNHENRE